MKFPYATAHDVPLFLAPMAGVSESPFRLLCRRAGADVVVSEFISAVGVARGIQHLFHDMRFDEAERPIGIQLYGADADVMARAAEMVTGVCRPDFIDINFGCPVKKVVRNNGGSGCLKDLGLVGRIIRAARRAAPSGIGGSSRRAAICSRAGPSARTPSPPSGSRRRWSTRDWRCGSRETRARRRSSSASTSAGTRRGCRGPRSCASGCSRWIRSPPPKRSSRRTWSARRWRPPREARGARPVDRAPAVRPNRPPPAIHPGPAGGGTVLIVPAGTSDLPVAEEAAVTARAFRNRVERLTDVGVAGIHRILTQAEVLRGAAVVIVVAGMEGALPSVVGGLVAVPVIAVPTSVGYGASFGGLAALLAMLNSCAAGVTVVNIDNGFGAAAAASRINHS